ncbi:DUF4376 domain-containing protein [Pseudomonas monteilii]|uniref:DUF4376 domain-containing protein n=1 Tax=Pseudomonas monteilii TaxID=76759 RepID=UPI0013E0A950|nr:DUF4376 domain-containing protein [Pseudomonas monteilii]QIG20497.1 DUF4376 domain-containing protein [Pseudomonas monteilii]QIG25747.1 DUF4376 domain-containing protein [Pseudomonas monteilii]
MDDIYIYQYDGNRVFTSAFKVEDIYGPVPAGTNIAPPELKEGEFAQWDGFEWKKLSSYPVPVLPEPPVPDWTSLIAARRYQTETAGIELQGMQVATDDRSKLLINGAALRASREPGYTLRWKTGDGFIDLSGVQVLAMADAVADHVQRCFDREAELLTAVADGSITAEMLEQGWP